MIFVGSYIGGRIQDTPRPADRRPHRRRHLQRRRHPRVLRRATPTCSGCSSSATASSAASGSAWPTSCRSPCCRSGSPTSRASSPASPSPASASARSSPRPSARPSSTRRPDRCRPRRSCRSGIGYLVALSSSAPASSATRRPATSRRHGARGGGHSAAGAHEGPGPRRRDFTPSEALHTPQWYLLTAILTMSVTAGISLISVAAGSADRRRRLLGRGGREPRRRARPLQRRRPHPLGLALRQDRQDAGVHGHPRHPGRLPAAHPARRVTRPLFAILAALVYTCYGGAFGTMPSTAGSLLRRQATSVRSTA